MFVMGWWNLLVQYMNDMVVMMCIDVHDLFIDRLLQMRVQRF